MNPEQSLRNSNSTYAQNRLTRLFRFRFLPLLALLAGLHTWTLRAQPVQNPGPNGTIDTWASGNDLDGHVPYHPQVTAYFCGAATMEMELDCNEIRSQNAVIDTMLGAGARGANPGAAIVDGAPQQCFFLQFNWPPVVFNGNQVVGGAQTYIYGLVHGLYTYNGYTYKNPYYPAGLGTTLDDVAVGLNLMDSPANAAGPHNYVAYNILNRDWANRTMVDGLKLLGIPAGAVVQHGAHWICVVGARTDVDPIANGAYKIYGFFIRDPWTGYQRANPFGPQGQLLPPGLGENKFLSTRINPDRAANAQLWSDIFNTASGPPLPLFGYGLGYKFEVEPIGPVALDTGNNGQYSSVPDPSPILTNAPLSALQAMIVASNAIAADTYLSHQAGFTNGTWDVTNAMQVRFPSDTSGEGDWFIPYEGSGGPNDVTAYVMIDEQTGDIDEAVWMNPGDAVPSMTLAQAETLESDEFAGILPNDNGAEPQLTLQLTNSHNVVLSWPVQTLTTNIYSVQQISSLDSTNWVTLTNTPTVVSNLYQVIVPTTGSRSFFRLTTSTNNVVVHGTN
ncbi:MAG TPA: hypothetical protein VN281_08125 [Verrucomicrobiae bacterium]|jgi:hypothetical protein|nr:hypothetical protein [Verrucomicrobiae bacterium]